MLAFLFAAAVAAPPPNPCVPKESCRYVASIGIVRPQGVDQFKADLWAPYLQDGRLRIFLGETIVVRLVEGDGGAKIPVVVSSGRAKDLPRGRGDEIAEWKFTGMQATLKDEKLGFLTSKDTPGSAVKADKDTLRFTLYQPPQGSVVVLRIDNGYDAKLYYRADMSWGDGSDRPTSVCPVRGVPNYETWSDPIVSMRVSDFRLGQASDARTTLDECQ
jgi:hypothetical protein